MPSMTDYDRFILDCLKQDKETYESIARKIFDLIEFCAKVKANPVSVYLASYTFSGFSGEILDRLALQLDMDSRELKDACARFYGLCMDDIDNMDEAQRLKNIKAWRKETKTSNYIG